MGGLAEGINVKHSYFARKEATGSMACMHGQEECDGNKQQLCVQQSAFNDGNLSKFVDFLLCQDETQSSIPKNGDACALRSGFAAESIYCNDGDRLLEESAAYTQSLGIQA